MRAARIDEPRERLLDRGVSDRATIELLAIVLDAAGADVHTLDAVARTIDVGELAVAAAMPDELSAAHELPPAAAVALMAAFELARRAAVLTLPSSFEGKQTSRRSRTASSAVCGASVCS